MLCCDEPGSASVLRRLAIDRGHDNGRISDIDRHRAEGIRPDFRTISDLAFTIAELTQPNRDGRQTLTRAVRALKEVVGSERIG
jgi:hypothetical protein